MATYAFPVIGYPQGKIPLHWARHPNAADLFAKAGTPIQAMVDGRIDAAGWDETGGWYVYLIGDPGTKSLHYYMAHMQERPAVATGQRVTVGQLLGKVGDTGNAVGTGAHLHIGIGTSIKSGSGPEGGAGVPWGSNNCNKYLQRILDTVGSGPAVPAPTPSPTPVGPTYLLGFEKLAAQLGATVVGEPLEDEHDAERSGHPIRHQLTTQGEMVFWKEHGRVVFYPDA